MNSGQAAGGSSIASIGLSTYATLLKAQGVATADQYQADRLTTAAQYGDLKAAQTGGQMTRSLNQTLGNIDAVRAAANSDPNSPTGAAFRDNQESIGVTQRGIAIGNINAQTAQERSDAAFYRQASSDAMLSGDISAAAGVFGAASPLLKGNGSSQSGGMGLSLTTTGGLY
ncbi:hypothetical protein UP09_30980 [Bradyrhizobium sp. LTSP885]|uniref:hypothetical protein n=1 Tax=Bradyrhizobium sp. LTSP885 TaxID=1619232 RepID=UPI0005C9BF71|nr:hypothetical protein [Bradyrhizobium sp. LTSP885]KJC35650.1 hypothetical protein UP09_30980 [Bradyrhizobium sp. LTSP885]